MFVHIKELNIYEWNRTPSDGTIEILGAALYPDDLIITTSETPRTDHHGQDTNQYEDPVMQTILVTGATGTLGREVVAQAQGQGVTVRALVHRNAHTQLEEAQIAVGDLITGSGLAQAMAGVDTIIHCATGFGANSDMERDAARNLINAATKTGSPHLVYISIVGVDKSAFSYFKAKLGVEQLIEQSGLPFTILRTTQFHNFILNLIRSSESDGVIRLPKGLTFQPIAVKEVAKALVALALGPAHGHAPDMAGPQILTLEDMAQTYVQALGKQLHVHVDAMGEPSEYHDAFRAKHNLAPDRAIGQQTWEVFLKS